MEQRIILRGLPKISLNKFYSGIHWSKRMKVKNEFGLIIKSQHKGVFGKKLSYTVIYYFYFKSRPLDTDNCSAMIKLINDWLFEDDTYLIIPTIVIHSILDKDERVEIIVKKIDGGINEQR